MSYKLAADLLQISEDQFGRLKKEWVLLGFIISKQHLGPQNIDPVTGRPTLKQNQTCWIKVSQEGVDFFNNKDSFLETETPFPAKKLPRSEYIIYPPNEVPLIVSLPAPLQEKENFRFTPNRDAVATQDPESKKELTKLTKLTKKPPTKPFDFAKQLFYQKNIKGKDLEPFEDLVKAHILSIVNPSTKGERLLGLDKEPKRHHFDEVERIWTYAINTLHIGARLRDYLWFVMKNPTWVYIPTHRELVKKYIDEMRIIDPLYTFVAEDVNADKCCAGYNIGGLVEVKVDADIGYEETISLLVAGIEEKKKMNQELLEKKRERDFNNIFRNTSFMNHNKMNISDWFIYHDHKTSKKVALLLYNKTIAKAVLLLEEEALFEKMILGRMGMEDYLGHCLQKEYDKDFVEFIRLVIDGQVEYGFDKANSRYSQDEYPWGKPHPLVEFTRQQLAKEVEEGRAVDSSLLPKKKPIPESAHHRGCELEDIVEMQRVSKECLISEKIIEDSDYFKIKRDRHLKEIQQATLKANKALVIEAQQEDPLIFLEDECVIYDKFGDEPKSISLYVEFKQFRKTLSEIVFEFLMKKKRIKKELEEQAQNNKDMGAALTMAAFSMKRDDHFSNMSRRTSKQERQEAMGAEIERIRLLHGDRKLTPAES